MSDKKKTRIKIKDIPKDKKISKEEMKKLSGGAPATTWTPWFGGGW